MNMKIKQRCLLGIFPVWMQFEDENGKEINEISGFWANIAHYTDLTFFIIANYLTFGLWDRDGFAFFPYEPNNCKYWHQALFKVITAKIL